MRILFILVGFLVGFPVFGQFSDSISLNKGDLNLTVLVYPNEQSIPASNNSAELNIFLFNSSVNTESIPVSRKSKQLAKELGLVQMNNKPSTFSLLTQVLDINYQLQLVPNKGEILWDAKLTLSNSELIALLEGLKVGSILSKKVMPYNVFSKFLLPTYGEIELQLEGFQVVRISEQMWESDFGFYNFLRSKGWKKEQANPEFMNWFSLPLRGSDFSISMPFEPELTVLQSGISSETNVYRTTDRKGRLFECANYENTKGLELSEIMKRSMRESIQAAQLSLIEVSPLYSGNTAQYQDVIFENSDKQQIHMRIILSGNEVIIQKVTYIPSKESNKTIRYFLNSLERKEVSEFKIPIQVLKQVIEFPSFPFYKKDQNLESWSCQNKEEVMQFIYIPASFANWENLIAILSGKLLGPNGNIQQIQKIDNKSVLVIGENEGQFFQFRITDEIYYYAMYYAESTQSRLTTEAVNFINQNNLK